MQSIYMPGKVKYIKRIASFVLDAIFFAFLFTGILYLLSLCFNYDHYYELYTEYLKEYGLLIYDAELDQYIDCTDPEAFNLAWQSFKANDEWLNVYKIIKYFPIFSPFVSAFISAFITYFLIPLIFKNGKTIGRKVLNLGLCTDECIAISSFNLFTRFLFGNLICNIFIPLFGAISFFVTHFYELFSIILVALILLLNIVLMLVSSHHKTIPDYAGKTFVVDTSEFEIFNTKEELNEAIKRERKIRNI